MELLVRAFNAGVSALLKNPWTGPWIGKGITMVSYAGRRSGRTFSIPVAYQRDGDQVTIRVDLPDAKNWWRNFTGDGGPVTLAGVIASAGRRRRERELANFKAIAEAAASRLTAG